jgi:hypothetical protein
MTIANSADVTIQTPHGDRPRAFRFVFADYSRDESREMRLEYQSGVSGEQEWRLVGGEDGPHHRVSWAAGGIGVGSLLFSAYQSPPPYWPGDKAKPKDDVVEFFHVTAFRREDDTTARATYFYVDLLYLGRTTRGDLKRQWGR